MYVSKFLRNLEAKGTGRAVAGSIAFFFGLNALTFAIMHGGARK
jgi:hypothetical protein